jgi:hypothetical protein
MAEINLINSNNEEKSQEAHVLFYGSDDIFVGLTPHMAFQVFSNPNIDKSEKNLEIFGLIIG